jgi:hypothetical protein
MHSPVLAVSGEQIAPLLGIDSRERLAVLTHKLIPVLEYKRPIVSGRGSGQHDSFAGSCRSDSESGSVLIKCRMALLYKQFLSWAKNHKKVSIAVSQGSNERTFPQDLPA